VRDVEYALRDHKEGEKVDVEVIRKGSKKTLSFEVPTMDRRHRFNLGFGNHDMWLDDSDFDFDVDVDIDPPDVDWQEDIGQSFKQEIKKLKKELRHLGREIEAGARKLQQELQAKVGQTIS
jgi:hypothetical protein